MALWRLAVSNAVIVKVGEEVEIVGIRPNKKTVCTGVEMFRKLLDQRPWLATTSVCCCAVLSVTVSERGQVLCKPGSSVKPHTKFEAEAYILTKEEGGRHTPFFANYRPAVLLPYYGRDRHSSACLKALKW